MALVMTAEQTECQEAVQKFPEIKGTRTPPEVLHDGIDPHLSFPQSWRDRQGVPACPWGPPSGKGETSEEGQPMLGNAAPGANGMRRSVLKAGHTHLPGQSLPVAFGS